MHRSMISRAPPTCVVNPRGAEFAGAASQRPLWESAKFGAPGREFTESANTNWARGVGSTGPVSHDRGLGQPHAPCSESALTSQMATACSNYAGECFE